MKKIKQNLLSSQRQFKQFLAVTTDAVICVLAVVASWSLQHESWFEWGMPQFWMLAIGLALSLPLFKLNGLYRAIFRYSGLQVLYTLNKVLFIYAVLYFLIFSLVVVPGVPKTMGVLQPVLLHLVCSLHVCWSDDGWVGMAIKKIE